MTNEYKNLVKYILQYGARQNCRNGLQKIIPFWCFNLNFNGTIPNSHILKLRKMNYKSVEGEFKTLIDPEPLTNVSQLEANGCNYWKTWAKEDGSINIDYANQMHPQLERLIEDIKQEPNSRRHIIDLWNQDNVYDNNLSLPCCWHNLTFSVIAGVLYLKWTQRSVDTMIGLPADIFLAYKFMQLVANKCGLIIGTCMFSLSNVHIYSEHIENAKILLERTEADYDKPLKFELKG